MPEETRPFRLLITGSQTWTDEQQVRAAIAWVAYRHGPENVTLVEGCAVGADELAEQVGLSWGGGLIVEHHPADWGTCLPDCPPDHRRTRRDGTTYCPGAGLRRDAEMVGLGADYCAAFIDPCAKPRCRKPKPHGSHGASHTARLAEKAGIPVRRYERSSHV
ncbi:SLOG family protein [Nonomuraea sp. NPDC050790]|uniref:SLOG family protein n=1 Tax=Nonomuraea sp. NPDC050790 TaxID=3364371 RepID=UPI00379518FD